MKIRNGFVSNSSSSSFVIKRDYLNSLQVEAIKDHIEMGKKLGIEYASAGDAWDIEVNEHAVRGFTIMDNFDMREFLQKIGVPADAIEFDGDNY